MAQLRRFEHSLVLTAFLLAACSDGEDIKQTDVAGAGGGVAIGGASFSGGTGAGGATATGGGTTLGGSSTGGQGVGGSGNGGGPVGAGGSGESTCVSGVDTDDACNPAVDTTTCVRSNRTCECNAGTSRWVCTPTTGQGGAPGTGGAPSVGGASAGGSGTGGANGGQPNGGTSTDGEPGNYPIGNAPVPSDACGTPTTLSTGESRINSTNQDRVYYLDIPANYDENKPYRLFYISHWIGSRYQDMVNNNFYGLKTIAQAEGEPAIFIAPSSDGQTWQEKDHALFDDLLAFAKENLCFDTSRVFATGFSFGGMITYSLSTNHQKDIRAAVGIAPANYNIWLPQKTREPIAWMQTTGMGDTTCPWIRQGSSTDGAKFLAEEKAEDNNCTAAEIPTWQNGDHLCYDYEGCDVNHPTKICTFNGGHQAESNDSTSSNWIPDVSWEFFTQF